MNRLRTKLILIFLAATLVPLAATVWVTTTLLDYALEYSSTDQLDALSKSLEATGREFYQRERAELKQRAGAGEVAPVTYLPANRPHWPEPVRSFADGDQDEMFALGGQEGDRLDYMVRRGGGVQVYSVALGEVKLERLRARIREARAIVNKAADLDIRPRLQALLHRPGRALLARFAGPPGLSGAPAQPPHPATDRRAGAACHRQPRGSRGTPRRTDEIGRAIRAFNHMAGRLQESTERLVYLRQMASWQTLARKTAHEVKNSLTPIRLTVEEMLARYDEADRAFMEQATQIVVDEIETLERRIRAFSQFAAEPPRASLGAGRELDARGAHRPAQACPPGGGVRLPPGGWLPPRHGGPGPGEGHPHQPARKRRRGGRGGGPHPGRHRSGGRARGPSRCTIPVRALSEQAQASLFQPTISFKKKGMGLGLSIAR